MKIKKRALFSIVCLAAVIIFVLYSVQNKLIGSGSNNTQSIHLLFKVNGNEYTISSQDNKIYVYSENGKMLSMYEFKNETILSSSISDLDRDSKDEIILLTSKDDKQYGDDLVVLSVSNFKERNAMEGNILFKELYRNHCKDLNPWKVQTSDVDGDGKNEISLGVYKTSPLHPVMAKRPFLYDWVNGGIFPKWRGSRLSRPFDDYVFLDLDNDGKDELISIEHMSNGDKVLTSYSWKGFGFEKTGESKSFKDISSISVKQLDREGIDAIAAKVKENNTWYLKTFYYHDSRLMIKE